MIKCENCKHECGYWDEYYDEEGNLNVFYSWECELNECYAPLCEDDDCNKYEYKED